MRNLLDRLFGISAVEELRASLRQFYILFLFALILNHRCRYCRSFEKRFANKSLDLSLAEALRAAFGELPGGFFDSISLADKKTSEVLFVLEFMLYYALVFVETYDIIDHCILEVFAEKLVNSQFILRFRSILEEVGEKLLL